jgi:hypothetical protein
MRDAVLSNLTFEAWSREPRTIDGLAAYAGRTYTVSILGESQRLQGAAVSPAMFDVLGVAPRGFYFPDRNAELWTPYVLPPAAKGNTSILRALANLRPGATLEQAVRGQAP